jgi:hypothetical protein
MRPSESKRTPPGSPPERPGDSRRRRSSGFLYQTVIGNPEGARTVFYDSDQGVLARPISNGPHGKKTDARYGELQYAKGLLDQKNEELRKVRKELEELRTEAARRTSQARLFREGENQLKMEAETRQLQMEDLRAQLADQLKKSGDLDFENKQLRAEVERLRAENLTVKNANSGMKEELSRLRFLANTGSQQSERTLYLETELKKQQEQLRKLERMVAEGSPIARTESLELVLRVTLPGGKHAELVLDVTDSRALENALNEFAFRHGLGKRSRAILKDTVKRERTLMLQGAQW